jgi:uncharacterized surface protein with fasciclin (FAS1) repeats
LVAAIDKAGLKATLSGAGTFTVFAPNNNAFRAEEITIELINSLTDSADIQEMKEVLLYHVLGSEVKSTQLSNSYASTLYKVGENGVSLKIGIAPVKLNGAVNVIGSLDDLLVNEDLPFKNAESNFTTVGETISGNIKGIPFSGFRSGLCIGYTF